LTRAKSAVKESRCFSCWKFTICRPLHIHTHL